MTASFVNFIILVLVIKLNHAILTSDISPAVMSNHISDNTTVNINQSTYSTWTPWTACENCWQNRLRICTSPKCKNSRVYEERPCDRKRCLRQRHMKSINKRLHIIKEVNRNNHMKTKNLKKSIWSKWSPWNKCSPNCKTERFQMCKKGRHCKTKRKTETAYCFVENTNCEIYILQLMGTINRKFEEITQYEYNTHIKPEPVKKKKPLYKKCGRPFRKLNMLKIIGGRDARKNKWPWHVAILNKYHEVFCSGTLIAPRWVLTAGHCVRNILTVMINEYDINQVDDNEIEIPVAEHFRHEKFNQITIDNDIALLRLPKAVNLTVACLPKGKPKVNQHCNIMGWGKLKNSDEYGSTVLQEAKIPIVNNGTCYKAYRKYKISPNMFCAGFQNGKVDTCAGDSGGGLMCRTTQGTKKRYLGYTVQGITSFGDGCGLKDKYGIYTNVHNYIDWIHDTIKGYKRRRWESNYVPIN